MADTKIGIRLALEGADQVRGSLAGVEKGLENLNTGLAKIGHYGTALLALPTIFNGTVGAAIKAADAVTTLNNQLRLATGSTEAAGQAYTALFDIAQRSRVSFTELGGTFAAISRAGQELGISQTRLLSVTEAIGNAMTVSGGSAAGMQAALTQLGQGLASGTLRGEELNSVMEQTPRLAKALADGLGVPIGKLREMGAAGQITAQQVIGALESQAAVLRGEVAGAVITVGQAFTQLQNASVKTVGEFDKASGASKTLAEAISGLSTGVTAAGKAFSDNENAIKTTIGVLAGAGTAVALARTATALGGVATGVGGVAGALTVLKGVVGGLSPITLGLLGLGVVVGGVSGYNAAHANDIDRMAAKLKELEAIQARGGKTIYGGESTGAQVKERIAEIDRLRTAIAAANEEKARSNIIPSGGSAERELAAANQKAAVSYDELRIRLSGFRGDYAKYQADLKQIQEGMASRDISEKQGIAMLTELAQKHGEVAKSAKASATDQGDAFASAREAAKGWADAMGDFSKITRDVQADSDGLSKAQARLVEYLGSTAYSNASDNMRELALQQAYAAINAENLAAALKTEDAAIHNAVNAWADLVAAQQGTSQTAQDAVRAQLEQNDTIGLSVTALASLEAAKLQDTAASKEQRAAVMDLIDPSMELGNAYRAEAQALRELASAKLAGAAKKAATDTANEAEAAWRKASEQIEQSLTDALMRGFESGKGFAEVLRDTVVNMFKTMVLRPIVSAIVSPVSGALASTLASTTATAATSGAVSGGLGASIGGFGMSVAEGFGGVGTGVLASSGSFGFGVGQALAAIPGWGWALAGIALLATMLDDSGTMHTGGGGSYSAATGAQATDATTVGLAKIDISVEATSAAKSIAEAIGKTLDGVAKTFGKTAVYTIATAFADDTSKDGAWGSLVIKKAGQTVLDWNDARTSRWAPKEFSDGEEGRKQYLKAVAKDVRDTLMTETPKWADNMLMALGDAPSIEQLAGTVQEINAMQSAIVTMTMASSQFAAVTEDGMAALIAAMGGAQDAVASLQSYYQNFFSEDERRSVATRQVSDAMAQLGLQMPSTRDGFRALVEAQDLTTEAGRNTYAALIALSPAFAQVVASVRASVAEITSGIQTSVAQAQQANNQAILASRSAALSALRTSIDREKTLYAQQAEAASQLSQAVQGVFDVLSTAITDLRAQAADPILAAQQGQSFITQSLATASATGVLPDQQALSNAIAAARGGLGVNNYASLADQQFAQLKLAGELEALQTISGAQLTSAEYQLQVAEDQLRALDETLAYWDQQVNAAQSNVSATLSVADSVRALQIALSQTLDSGFASISGIGQKTLQDQLQAVATQYSPGTTTEAVSQLTSSVMGGSIGLNDAVNYLAGTGTTSRLFDEQVNVLKNFDAAGYYAEIRKNIDLLIGQGMSGQVLSQTLADMGVSLTDAGKAYGVTPAEIAANLLRAGATTLPQLAVGTNYVPHDMVAQLHQGEAVVPKAYNPWASGGAMGGSGNTQRLESLVEGLTAEVQRLQALVAKGNEHTRRTADNIDQVTEGGAAMRTTATP